LSLSVKELWKSKEGKRKQVEELKRRKLDRRRNWKLSLFRLLSFPISLPVFVVEGRRKRMENEKKIPTAA